MDKINKKIVINFIFLAFLFNLPQIASATIYQPGETLEPDCAPGSVNCGVATTTATTGDWTGTFDSQEGSYYLDTRNLINFGGPFYTFFHSTTTDALTQGSTNKYYSDLSVNSYINASTTVPKTYTANTFAGLQTLNGGLTIDSLNGPLQANNGLVSATTSIGVLYGGTGTSNGSITGTGALSFTSNTTNTLTLDSGTTGTINLGTNANAKTITFGNITGATRVNLNAGTGGVFLTGLAAQTNGNLIVCINNTTKRLYVGNSATSCNTSSARYKHDIADIDLGLDAVKALHPVSYIFNSNDEKSLGFIAEEVALIDERLINRNADGIIEGINPDAFIPILTKATQEQQLLIGDISSSSTLVATVQSEIARDPLAIIAQKITDGKQFLTDFVAARVIAIRGYFDEIFAKKIHTEQVCVKKFDGSEVCVNGDQINSLLQSANVSPAINSEVIINNPEPTTTTEEVIKTPIVDEPAVIESAPTAEEVTEPPIENVE